LTGSIARVEAVDVRVPLPQPLQLGAMRIESRGYAAVTVTTDDGLTGHAIALNRDTPVAAAVNGLSRNVLTPGPCRPWKLRLLVLATYSPGAAISPFMPTQRLQPGKPHNAPADLKTECKPSDSA